MPTGNSITYNGITLDAASIRICNRQAIVNGPDYIYTSYELHVRAVYNPKYPGNSNNSPVQYDQLIRHKLAQVRQSLKIEIQTGGKQPRTWVEIDGEDAQLGPIPVLHNVVQIIGTKTWLVDFGIRFSVNECSDLSPTPSVLLSNRWDQSQVFDQQYYAAVRVAGRAVFRTDLLAQRRLTADQLRQWLLLPVGFGMKREQLSVSQSQDGAAIRYEFVDLQKSIAVPDPDLADVEIYTSISTTHQGREAAYKELATTVAKTAGSLAQSGSSLGQAGVSDLIGSLPNYGKYASASMLSGPLLPFMATVNEIGGTLGILPPGVSLSGASPAHVPKTAYHCRIIAYGTPNIDRGKLVQRVIQIMAARMPFSTPSLHGTAANLQLNEHRRVATLDYTVEMGPCTMIASAYIDAAKQLGNVLTPGQMVQNITDIEARVAPDSFRALEATSGFFGNTPQEVLNGATPIIQAGPNAANPVKQSPTRGSHPFALLTAALLGPCEVPADASGLRPLPVEDNKPATPTQGGK